MRFDRSGRRRTAPAFLFAIAASALLAGCAASKPPACDPLASGYLPGNRVTAVRVYRLPLDGADGYRLTASFTFPGTVPAPPQTVLLAIAGAPAHEQLRGSHDVLIVLDDAPPLRPEPRYYGKAENHNEYETVVFDLPAADFRRLANAHHIQVHVGALDLTMPDFTRSSLQRLDRLMSPGAQIPRPIAAACPTT